LSSLERNLDSTAQAVQTDSLATKTAISGSSTASQTPVPDPRGIDWSAVEGLELEFWYVWDLDEPGLGMNAIVDRFNQENEWGISVIPRDRGLVLDPLASVESAFEEGQIPHIMVGDSSVLTGWYQSGMIIDLNPYFEDPVAGMIADEQEDFFPDLLNEFDLTGSARLGVPFSQSIQVIYYNKSWAEELGLSSLPRTANDIWDQSCVLTTEGDPAGVVLSPQSANILSFIYAYRDDPLLEDEEYKFSSWRIQQFVEDWKELILAGCGQLIYNYPNPMAVEGEFERFNQRQALMIMGSSVMQEHIQMGADQAGEVDEWQMLAFLGLEGTKAVVSEVQSVFIFESTPETELASWLFLQYLISPEVQAEWSQYSGYYPTRKESLKFLQEFRIENPEWASGLDVLNNSRSAPLHPSWQVVKLAVEDAFEELLANPELELKTQLEALDQVAAELLEWSQD
jgi:ABC-type glycerol-3-phosphate transport system substrate-binding protein